MNRYFIIFFSIIFLSSCATRNLPGKSIAFSERTIDFPEIFAEGVISVKDINVFNFTFTNNDKTIYFTRRQGNGKQKIYFTKIENNKWIEP